MIQILAIFSIIQHFSTFVDFANSFRPRAHSLEGISRAKIKSVKQTIVVITGYVLFSGPAVIVQLWRAWIQGQNQLGQYKIVHFTSDKSSQNWNGIYFQKRNKLQFHLGYAKSINFGTCHNIKFLKTKSTKIIEVNLWSSSERVTYNQ